jgi:uncharacterized membrane protein YhdT
MITALIYAVIYILVGYLLTYVVAAYLPVDANVKQIINIIIWLVVALAAIRLLLGALGMPVP